jgi:hypothetical protein
MLKHDRCTLRDDVHDTGITGAQLTMGLQSGMSGMLHMDIDGSDVQAYTAASRD